MAKKKKKSEYYVPEEYRAAYEQAKKDMLYADFEALVSSGPWHTGEKIIKAIETIHRRAQGKKRGK